MSVARHKKSATVRINISLQRPLLQAVNRLASGRQRSRFIATVLEAEVERRRRFEAFERGFGAWAGPHHADLDRPGGAVAYQRRLRQDGERRRRKQMKRRG